MVAMLNIWGCHCVGCVLVRKGVQCGPRQSAMRIVIVIYTEMMMLAAAAANKVKARKQAKKRVRKRREHNANEGEQGNVCMYDMFVCCYF